MYKKIIIKGRATFIQGATFIVFAKCSRGYNYSRSIPDSRVFILSIWLQSKFPIYLIHTLYFLCNEIFPRQVEPKLSSSNFNSIITVTPFSFVSVSWAIGSLSSKKILNKIHHICLFIGLGDVGGAWSIGLETS